MNKRVIVFILQVCLVTMWSILCGIWLDKYIPEGAIIWIFGIGLISFIGNKEVWG